MARRLIVDGIKLEGEEAERIINEVMLDVDDAGAPRRILPLSLLLVVAIACGIAAGVAGEEAEAPRGHRWTGSRL